MLKRFADKKVWVPLVGSVALAWGAWSGVEITPEMQAAVVENLAALFGAAGALLVAVAAWHVPPKK